MVEMAVYQIWMEEIQKEKNVLKEQIGFQFGIFFHDKI